MRVSLWGYSSAGRALAWHARGHRFDPVYLHHRTVKRAVAVRAAFLLQECRSCTQQSSKTCESPSSRGLGHCPFTAVTPVRIRLGTPKNTKALINKGFFVAYRIQHVQGARPKHRSYLETTFALEAFAVWRLLFPHCLTHSPSLPFQRQA